MYGHDPVTRERENLEEGKGMGSSDHGPALRWGIVGFFGDAVRMCCVDCFKCKVSDSDISMRGIIN